MADPRTLEPLIVKIINDLLARRGVNSTVSGDTDIFADRLIDSVSFAELLSVLELELDIEVPDHKLSTEYFRTPATIADTFGRS